MRFSKTWNWTALSHRTLLENSIRVSRPHSVKGLGVCHPISQQPFDRPSRAYVPAGLLFQVLHIRNGTLSLPAPPEGAVSLHPLRRKLFISRLRQTGGGNRSRFVCRVDGACSEQRLVSCCFKETPHRETSIQCLDSRSSNLFVPTNQYISESNVLILIRGKGGT